MLNPRPRVPKSWRSKGVQGKSDDKANDNSSGGGIKVIWTLTIQ